LSSISISGRDSGQFRQQIVQLQSCGKESTRKTVGSENGPIQRLPFAPVAAHSLVV